MKHTLFTFISGILFLFGLSDNPINALREQYASESDESKLAGDWYKIGNDIRHSYDKLSEKVR